MDDEGYLVDYGAWSEELAATLERQENIKLGDAQWVAIRFMRDFYQEHWGIPDVRFDTRPLLERLGGSRNLIYMLSPGFVCICMSREIKQIEISRCFGLARQGGPPSSEGT